VFENGFPHAASGGKYKPSNIIPGDCLREVAVLSQSLLSQAKNPPQFRSACINSVPLAEKYCAGVLDRFFRLWQGKRIVRCPAPKLF